MGHCTKLVQSLRRRNACIAVAAGALLAGGGMSLAEAAPASAAPVAVVNCSAGANLQDAINSASSGETLYVRGTCTGNFTIGSFAIAQNLTIVGPATLNGNGSGAVLFVIEGTVTLENVTIEGGNNLIFDGGGILNDGTLSLEGSRVTGNTATYFGGGILNIGTLTLNNSQVQGNSAGAGGGIYNFGTATLVGSPVQANTAIPVGGLISLPNGGGIYNAGTLTLEVSPVTGNSANQDGGGIANVGTTLLLGSSVQANTARDGGGIYNDDTLTLKGSLVTANSASQLGGGIYNDENATTPTVEASKVAGNTPDDIYP